MFETAQWLEQFRAPPVTVLEGALAAQAIEQSRDDAAQERRDAEVRESAEARAEGLELANRALGNPAGEVAQLRSALAACDDEVADLREKLGKAEARQGRVRENLTWWSERWALAVEATTARTVRQDPAEAAVLRAKAALDDYRRSSRKVLARAREQHAGRFR
jgi:hypothetical protein